MEKFFRLMIEKQGISPDKYHMVQEMMKGIQQSKSRAKQQEQQPKRLDQHVQPESKRTKNLYHKIYVTLEDVYTKKHRKISVKRKRVCIECKGNGLIYYKGNHQHMITCSRCNGKVIAMTPKVFDVPCYHSKSVFTGESDETPNQLPGDIIIDVEIEKHDEYTVVDDYNLQIDHEVSLSDLMEGEHEFKITHLDGEKVVVILPQLTSVITRGYLLRKVIGKGLPMGSNRGGDLLVNIIVNLE